MAKSMVQSRTETNENLKVNTFFKGKNVVVTGKLENYTRAEINRKITMLGAKAGSSVSRYTDFLIVGERAGSKLARAQNFGIRILTEREFEEMRGWMNMISG